MLSVNRSCVVSLAIYILPKGIACILCNDNAIVLIDECLFELSDNSIARLFNSLTDMIIIEQR